jgi:hypothetical protein
MKKKINQAPNPLELFDIRRVSICPEHFETTTISFDDNTPFKIRMELGLVEWIEANTTGRYYLRKFKDSVYIGFEQPKELTFFIMSNK